jgi:hypothetical protein
MLTPDRQRQTVWNVDSSRMASNAAMSAPGDSAVRGAQPRSAEAAVHRVEWAGRWLAEAGLPFALILYLALKGGGYVDVVYEEVGWILWWLVLLGVLIGVLPLARMGLAARLALGAMAAFVAWTALAIGWSSSAEQSAIELARVATYLSVFLFMVLARRPGSARRTVNAVAVAIAVIGALALVQRFHPSWLPANDAGRILAYARARLNYPLNYWNGLAALVAMGIPLLVVIATRARTLAGGALAAAAVPAMALTAFYTLSRGGAIEIAVALAVLLALYPRRFALLPTLAAGAVGSVMLIVAANQRDALENGLLNATARDQAGSMVAMTLVVCAGVGLIQVAIATAARHGIGPRPQVASRTARRAVAACLAVFVVVAVAAGLPGYLSDRWDHFKQPTPVAATGVNRFDSASGNGRYQWWQSAVDANATAPLIGIGPGTFQYWWREHASIPGPVLDAHSLYLQTLAEVGIVGLALILVLFGTVFFFGARAALRRTVQSEYAAAAVAACAAFAVAAAIDWVWQLAVLPVAFFVLAAVLVAREAESSPGQASAASRAVRWGAIPAFSIAAVVAIALPLAGAIEVGHSQAAARVNNLGAALGSANSAHGVQPYAASPALQQALVYELQGNYDPGVAAAKRATRADSTNWQTWVILSRLQAEAGNADAAVSAYKHARMLNPLSPIFAK